MNYKELVICAGCLTMVAVNEYGDFICEICHHTPAAHYIERAYEFNSSSGYFAVVSTTSGTSSVVGINSNYDQIL